MYNQIKAEIEKGVNTKTASVNLNLPYKSVSRVVKSEGWDQLDIYPKKNKSASLFDKNRDLIIEMLEEGKTAKEIADYFSTPVDNLNFWLAQRGVSKNNLIYSRLWREGKYIKNQLAKGETVNKISKEVKVSPQTLNHFLESNRDYFSSNTDNTDSNNDSRDEENRSPKSSFKRSRVLGEGKKVKVKKKTSAPVRYDYKEEDYDFLLPTTETKDTRLVTSDPEVTKEVRRLLLLGYTPYFISRQIEVSRHHIIRFAKNHNFHLLPHYSSIRKDHFLGYDSTIDENLPEIREMAEEGTTFTDIYKHFNPKMSLQTFTRKLKELGITPRKVTLVERLAPYKKEIKRKLKTRSINSVSKEYGISYSTIKRVLKG